MRVWKKGAFQSIQRNCPYWVFSLLSTLGFSILDDDDDDDDDELL